MLIICAMEKEAKNISVPDADIFITGIGVCNVIKSIRNIDADKYKTIVNVGYAGSSNLQIGSVVSVKNTKRYLGSNVLLTPEIPLNPIHENQSNCISADDFIESNNEYLPLVDMELYYLALAFPQIQSIKIVSDNLGYSQYEMFNKENSWKEVNNLLIELQRRNNG